MRGGGREEPGHAGEKHKLTRGACQPPKHERLARLPTHSYPHNLAPLWSTRSATHLALFLPLQQNISLRESQGGGERGGRGGAA